MSPRWGNSPAPAVIRAGATHLTGTGDVNLEEEDGIEVAVSLGPFH